METVRIVIEFNGEYAQQNADDKIDDVRQLFMRRNPLDEPYIFIESIPSEEEECGIHSIHSEPIPIEE